MHALYLAAVLLCSPAEIPDGTLMFLEKSNRFVEIYTEAKITHVGIVMNIDGEPWVYEATPGKVRLVRLNSYYQEIGTLNSGRRKVRMILLSPKTQYDDDQRSAMRKYLDSQLDRRYSVKNYIRKRAGDGIHCAELTANCLESTGSYEFGECFDISPQTLFDKVKSKHDVTKEFFPEPPPVTESWCTRTSKWWVDLLLWCQWCGYEGWTFCRG